jgi:hypothetical protein
MTGFHEGEIVAYPAREGGRKDTMFERIVVGNLSKAILSG